MEFVWIGVGVVLALALGYVWRGSSRQAPPADVTPATAAAASPVKHAASSRTPPAMPQPAPGAMTTLPPALAAYRPVKAQALTPERRQAIVEVFHHVPRPPRLLDNLLSPDFVARASSSELADLIVAEPLISARLLATINSPLYGLRTPVASIDQAVTLLGLNTVRSICLQYLLIASFKADSPQRQALLDSTWQASALASELTQQLAQRLGLPEPGALVSAVVLSFLGRLATAATMPRGLLAAIPAKSLLARAQAEQDKLGLAASEIGRLLMNDWGLPANLADDAAQIDAVMVTPFAAMEPVRASRLAVCYLCARLGERLATGDLDSLADVDPRHDHSPEFHHLQGYLAHPTLAPLAEQLQSPALDAAMQKMLQALREPAVAA
jgi:HD-like signal output (HDOD) protein